MSHQGGNISMLSTDMAEAEDVSQFAECAS